MSCALLLKRKRWMPFQLTIKHLQMTMRQVPLPRNGNTGRDYTDYHQVWGHIWTCE